MDARMNVTQPSDCKSCLGINIESLIEPATSDKQIAGYRHSASLQNLMLSSKKCPVCAVLLSSLIKSREFKSAEWQLDQTELWLELLYWGDDWYWCNLKLAIMTDKQPNITNVGIELKVSTLKDDPAAQTDLSRIGPRIGAFRLPWRVDVGENTKSEHSFAIARQWLKDCVAEHDTSGSTIDKRRILSSFSAGDHQETSRHPRLLIDCFANVQFPGDRNLRPRDNQSNYTISCELVKATKHHQPYACLSYCWGPAENTPWVTTSVNVAARKTLLDQKTLPKTLRDAIDICRRLNIRYLWIDALCIPQDCQNEWLMESTNMDSIYGKALVTICAAASSSSQAGIFNDRSASDFEAGSKTRHSFLIRSKFQDGRDSVLEFSVVSEECKNPTQGHEYRRGPLQNRGWCCQERHLSRRKIFYGSSQLYWECDHLLMKEDGSFDYKYVEPVCRNSSPRQRGDTPQKLALSWYSDVIANDYSTRQLSRSTDKLIAIAGLARRASVKMGSTYIAGIWPHAICEGLLWERRASIGRKQVAYRAPSWSWASQDSAITFYTLGAANHIWHCELISITARHQTTDVFGVIESANLKLKTALLMGSIETPPCDALPPLDYVVAFHLDGIGHGYACMDDNRVSSGHVLAALLCEPSLATDRPKFMILEGPTRRNEYKRIGLGWVDLRWPCIMTESNRDAIRFKSVDTMQLDDLQKTELSLI